MSASRTTSRPRAGSPKKKSQPAGAAAQRPAASARQGVRVSLDLQAPDLSPPLSRWLPVQARRAAELAGVSGGELNLTLVDDATMADLHERYKNVPGTTDVLTFDLRDDPADPLEGDVVLCVDEAVRQAAQRGHEPRLEVLLYAVHGLLHLLGEDDEDEAAAERMHRREDELLTALGWGPVFASRGGG